MKWTGTRPTDPQIVTASDIQASLRVTDAFPEDQFIDDIGEAAIEYAEQALDSSLLLRAITATFYRRSGVVDLGFGYIPRDYRLFLPRGPVQSVLSVTDANQTPPAPTTGTYTITVPNNSYASVSLTTLTRSDTSDVPSGVTVPVAMTLANGQWTATFTDTAPPAFYYYEYTATPTAGSVVEGNGTVIGVTGTTSGTNWVLEREGNADLLRMTNIWTGPLTVVYLAGYGTTAKSIPADVRMAIRMHAATLFEQRASTDEKIITPVPHSLDAFYALRRRTCPVG